METFFNTRVKGLKACSSWQGLLVWAHHRHFWAGGQSRVGVCVYHTIASVAVEMSILNLWSGSRKQVLSDTFAHLPFTGPTTNQKHGKEGYEESSRRGPQGKSDEGQEGITD